MRQGFLRLPGAGFLLALLAVAVWFLKGDLISQVARGETDFRSEWVFLDVPGAAAAYVRAEPEESLGRFLERNAAGLRSLLPPEALDVPLQGGERISVLEESASASPLLVVEPLPERIRFLMGRPLNLNRATAGEMALLPGVGPKLGQRIEAFRNASGDFRSQEDLRAVSGLGRALVSRIQNRICFAHEIRSFPLLCPGSSAGGRAKTLPEVPRTGP